MNNQPEITIYKFRLLKSCEDLYRIEDIIKAGKFWYSKFFELNDPMEGVYRAETINIVENMYNQKKYIKNLLIFGKNRI